MTKASLGDIRPCAAPGCTISTNKRYHTVPHGTKEYRPSVAVACCPDHAKKALALSEGG